MHTVYLFVQFFMIIFTSLFRYLFLYPWMDFFLLLSTSSQAVRLVADLCLDNNINDPQLWNSVLQQLLAFGMVSYIYRVGHI